MRFERRSVFGWPATEAGWAPCKNGLVVHYDGSNQSLANKQHSSCRTYWKNTRRFHMNERDWLDIGYSFAVCPHGYVLEGRGWQRQQAAQPGGNSSWTSCTFMSGPSERPTSAQVAAFRELRAWLRGKGLAAAVSYHGRFISTSCLPLDSTEILARRGWIPLGDVTPDDEVASWSMDSGTVTFDRPAGMVEPYEAETLLIDRFESTPDHNWVTYGARPIVVACSCGHEGSPACLAAHGREGRRRGEAHQNRYEEQWKLVRADQMKRVYRYLGAVDSDAPGLDLTDEQVRLMVWLQGDGHIMREHRRQSPVPYGVEWHLRKSRKVERLAGLLHALGIEYRRNERADGTVSLRVYGNVARQEIISLLPDKRFHWGLLDLSRHQAEVFLDELLHVDGCEAGAYYSSTDEVNLDVVQAIAVLNGQVATRGKDPHKVLFRRRDTANRPAIREVHTIQPGRTTQVGCLTTVNGTLIVRQHGRTVVIGNCPGSILRGMVTSGSLISGSTPTPPREDDMALSAEDKKWIKDAIREVVYDDDSLPAPNSNPDDPFDPANNPGFAPTNATWAGKSFPKQTIQGLIVVDGKLDGVGEKLDGLAATGGTVDLDALAAKVADLLAARLES